MKSIVRGGAPVLPLLPALISYLYSSIPLCLIVCGYFQGVLNATILHLERKYDGQLVYKRLVNGYRKFDPARGMDYVLDLACKDSVTGHETHTRFVPHS